MLSKWRSRGRRTNPQADFEENVSILLSSPPEHGQSIGSTPFTKPMDMDSLNDLKIVGEKLCLEIA